MTEDLTKVLNDLADRVADEFKEDRLSDELRMCRWSSTTRIRPD